MTFLEETIISLLSKHGSLSNSTLILPSKRARGFVMKHLQLRTESPVFAPRIINIEEFIEDLAGLKICSNQELLLHSYQAYLDTEEITQKDTFEDFLGWIPAVLADFNEIDRHIVPQNEFFDYLNSIKTLEMWGVEKKDDSEMIQNYLEFWKHLHHFYIHLNAHLRNLQLGYQGMVYRKAAEDLEYYLAQNSSHHHVFIGFNALNQAEQAIIQELLEQTPSEIYWDLDRYFAQDKTHNVSHFINGYVKAWKYYQNHPVPEWQSNYESPKQIQIIKAPGKLGQVKYLNQLLDSFTTEDLDKTAIVLADESLLIPVLHSLPSHIKNVNVTMGVNLGRFPYANFVIQLCELYEQRSSTFHHQMVVRLLTNPLARLILKEPEEIITQISSQNRAYLTGQNLVQLGSPSDRERLNTLFLEIPLTLEHSLKRSAEILAVVDFSSLVSIDALVIQKLREVINNLKWQMRSHPYLNKVKKYVQLVRDFIHAATIDLVGDAYKGLQILGVLETRCLDFKKVVMLSVNEGVIPSGKSSSSYLTYDLKKQFGLPSYTDKDAIYAYHFYRLMQRAEAIYLSYHNIGSGLETGEKSRFLIQMEVNKPDAHTLEHPSVTPAAAPPNQTDRRIQKDPKVMKTLLELSTAYLSPSALSAYIRNPIDFYFQKIIGADEFDEVEETVASKTLGNIVHSALENIYTPWIGRLLKSEKLKAANSLVSQEVSKQFDHHFRKGSYLSGKNLLIFEVAKRYVSRLLELDISALDEGHQIKLIALEKKMVVPLQIPELTFDVNLGGKIDRIDEFNGVTRIIDYKTGKVNNSDMEIINWEDLTADYRYSKAFQVLCYTYMLHHENASDAVEAGVISFKNFGSGFMRFAKKEKARGPKHFAVNEEIRVAFRTQLHQLILELFDEGIPFIEKQV